MRLIPWVLVVVIHSAAAGAVEDYWGHVKRLAEQGSAKGSPALISYLKELSPEEMLQAARQYSTYAEGKFAEVDWEAAIMDVGLVMTFYGNEEGGLANDRLAALLECVRDEDEGKFFRESMVGMIRHRYWAQLTQEQREESKQVFAGILSNRSAPPRLRARCCWHLALAIAEEYRSTLMLDSSARAAKAEVKSWSALYQRIRKGEVNLKADTRGRLGLFENEISHRVRVFERLAESSGEPEEVRERARFALKTITDLPVVTKP